MDQPLNPRRGNRNPLVLAAQCRTATGIRDEGYLSDLSSDGCCISTRSLTFVLGARVLVKPFGLEGLSGIVRWINGHKAGVQFDNPLYGPIVDHLTAQYPSDRPITVTHRAKRA